jgi:hypothetical protein
MAEAAGGGWMFTYRRWLSADLQIQDTKLRERLGSISLVPEDDIHVWDSTKNGQFAVKSVYKDISNSGIDRSFKHLCKSKIPLKIKVWLWLIWHNAIATKDIMSERGWGGYSVPVLIRMKTFIISSSLSLRPNVCGAVLLDQLVPRIDLGIFPVLWVVPSLCTCQ